MEQNGQNTPPAREEDRLPPNVTRRGRRRTGAEPTPEERAEADALMAGIMAPRPRQPAVPYLEQLLGQQGPPPNVTQRRPQPADDVNELLGAFRQFMNNLEMIRIQRRDDPHERTRRITDLVNNYFRQRNLIVQLEITRLAQLGQTLPENYTEQAMNEFLAIVNSLGPHERIGVNRFIRQVQEQGQA